MGFFLTLVYIAVSLLSPKDLMPALEPYRVELLVGIFAVLCPFKPLVESEFFSVPQSYLLVGLFIAVFCSIALAGEHWVGGGFLAFQRFLPSAIVFYMILVNCRTTARLQAVATLLMLISIFYVLEGAKVYYSTDKTRICRDDRVPLSKLSDKQAALPTCNPHVEVVPVSDGTVTLRMQGLGVLRDPNELSQLLVTILPFVWLRWRPGLYLQNLLFVVAPSAIMVWGIYLTHSRGAVIALVVVLMLALKGRMGFVSTLLGGAFAFAAALALNFSGGREISVQGGSDRLQLWGAGLSLFRSSPWFGIGFQEFGSKNNGHTAHNSFVVCLAELGIVGYTFWVSMIAFTFAGLNSIIRARSSSQPDGSFTDDAESSEPESSDTYRWARTLRISLVGYLVASFFLSRAFTMTLFLILGMSVAVVYLLDEEEDPVALQSTPRLLAYSAALGISAIAVVYASIHMRGVFGS